MTKTTNKKDSGDVEHKQEQKVDNLKESHKRDVQHKKLAKKKENEQISGLYAELSLLSTNDVLEKENDEGNVEYKWKLCNLTEERFKHLVTQMKYRLSEGQGEAIYELGINDEGIPLGLSEEEFKESYENVQKMAKLCQAECSIICEKVIEDKTKKNEPVKKVAEILVRSMVEGDYLDIRIAVCGNVDSGKSTLVGVLTRGKLDNGRGLARTNVFVHKHELTTGRTSSISHQILGFNSKGEIVNYNNSIGEDVTWKDIIEKSSKVCTFLDLAGHEKYLKTTVFGMTGSVPDYSLIVIGANMGITRMTKEHLGLSIALKIPIIIIITKIDICPENILKETIDNVHKILKLPGVRKLPYHVRTDDDVITCAKNIVSDRIAPIFLISCVTGKNLSHLRKFLNLLPVRRDWESLIDKPAEFYLDQTFFVTGVGTVSEIFLN